MKTFTSILLHVGVGAAQVVVPFAPTLLSTAPLPPLAQIPIQAGLLALQGYLAHRNSNTDPAGNPLAQIDKNKYVSVARP